MDIYCTSKNYGPSWQSDPITMVYLGTSLEEAEAAVGDFSKYLRTNYNLRARTYLYTALPIEIESELIKYYMADGWWYTIVKFELLPPPMTKEQVETMLTNGEESTKIPNLVFAKMEEVTLVTEAIAPIVTQYGFLSLGDLRDLVGMPKTIDDEQWGWRKLNSVKIHHTTRGYEMEFPLLERI